MEPGFETVKQETTTIETNDGWGKQGHIIEKGAVAHLARLAMRIFDAPAAVVTIGERKQVEEIAVAGPDEEMALDLLRIFDPLLDRVEEEPLVVDVEREFALDRELPTITGESIRTVIACRLGSSHPYGVGVIWIFDNHHAERVQEDYFSDLRALTSLLSDELEMRGAYASLEETNRRLHMILQVVPDVLVFATPDRRITTVNKGLTEHFGYRPEEVLGRKTRFLYADEHDFESTGQRYRPGAADKEEPYRLHYRRKDGSTFLGETIGVHVRDDQGRTLGYLGIIEDVTEAVRLEEERREAVEKLYRSEELLRETSHMAGVGGGEYRADTNELNWSDELYRLHDLMPGTPLSLEDTMTFFDPSDAEHIARVLERTLSSGETFETEVALTTAKGRRRIVRVKGKPIIEEGRPVGVTGYHQDITAQKQAEQAKREFISVVSHELRTPLTSIRGTLGLVVGGVVGKLPDETRELLNIALKNTTRLGALIDDLLDMEKIESGKLEIFLRPTDPGEVVDEVIESNHRVAADAQVELRTNKEDGLPLIQVDPNRLFQVLTNFVSNAIKYSFPGDTVDITILPVEPQSVRIAVRDQGPGIPEAFQPRLFEKFTQADSTDARRRQGTGLGLNIARALTEEMGGQIGFETTPGEGTTIYVDFHIAAADEDQI